MKLSGLVLALLIAGCTTSSTTTPAGLSSGSKERNTPMPTLSKINVGVSKFVGTYSDGTVVSPNAKVLVTSGFAPVDKNGNVPDGIEAQAELVWQNLFATLEAAGMKPTDLVKTTSYVVRAEDVPAFVKVRAKYLGDIKPSQMLLLTPGFINPKFLVEVDAIAAAE